MNIIDFKFRLVNMTMAAEDSKRILNVLRGSCLTLALLGFHILVFVTSLSICLVFGTVVSMVYELYFGYKTGIAIVTMIAILPLKYLAMEILLFQAKSKSGLWLVKKKKVNPIALVKVPTFLYSGLFVIASYQVYYRYAKVHFISPDISGVHGALAFATNGSKRFWDFELSPILFSLSVLYMVYIMSRENDWTKYYRQLSETDRKKLQERVGLFLTICTWFFYFIVQIVLLTVYGIPLLLILVICASLNVSSCITFITLTTTAFLIGVAAVEVENAEPFPEVPFKAPRYYLECHLLARETLACILWIPLVGLFSRFPKLASGRVTQTETEEYFLTYLLVVSMTVIQGTKVMLNTVQQHCQTQESPSEGQTHGTHNADARTGGRAEVQLSPPNKIDLALSDAKENV